MVTLIQAKTVNVSLPFGIGKLSGYLVRAEHYRNFRGKAGISRVGFIQ